MNRRLELHPSSLIPQPLFIFSLLRAHITQHVVPQKFVRGHFAQALNAIVLAGALGKIARSGVVVDDERFFTPIK
jgi:hypothetical protein